MLSQQAGWWVMVALGCLGWIFGALAARRAAAREAALLRQRDEMRGQLEVACNGIIRMQRKLEVYQKNDVVPDTQRSGQ